MISVIIAWKGGNRIREENLKNTLDCLTKQTEQNFELCLVKRELPYFNKCWLFNIGARRAKYKHLVFLDADMLFGEDLLSKILDKAKDKKYFICWDKIILKAGKDNPVERNQNPNISETIGGCFYFDKDYYFNVFGGMNENFKGYGAEDNEAYDRLLYLSERPIPRMEYTLTHQYHDWAKVDDREGSDYRANLWVWLFTKKHPKLVIERLIKAEVGKSESPTFIAI